MVRNLLIYNLAIFSVFLLSQAERWYDKAAKYWPYKSTSKENLSNYVLSPASYHNIQLYQDDLAEFCYKYPPLSCKELLYLETFADKMLEAPQKNRAKLLAHRCSELEKTIRARETYLMEFGMNGENSREYESADDAGKTPRFENDYYYQRGEKDSSSVSGVLLCVRMNMSVRARWVVCD